MKSQRDSSFPADGHKAILNKMKNKSKTNRKRTNINNFWINHNRSTALERSVISYFGLKPVLRALNLLLWFIYTYKLFGPREGLLPINESNRSSYKSRFITEMKQDEYSTARPDAGATEVKQLNPGGTDSKTEHQAATNLIKSFINN